MKSRWCFLLIFLVMLSSIGVGHCAVNPDKKGQELKIAIKQFPPFVFEDEVKGFCIDVADIICAKNNLTPQYKRYNSIPEVLEAVESGEVDIGFSGITITADRERRVDFSQPFFDSGLMIAVRSQPGSQIAYISGLLLKVVVFSLAVLFIGLTVVAHIIWLLERDDTDQRSFSTIYRHGIIDAYWWALVTMTTVGYGDKCPKMVSGRIIASLWMIIGIIWFAGFTATLSSALTVNRIRHGDVRDISDLEGKKIAVIPGTTSEELVRYHNVEIVAATSFDDLIKSLKNDEAEAIIYDAPALMYAARIDPAIKVVGKMFDEQQYGVVFPENGHEKLKEVFNIAILEMKKNGELRKIHAKWF